MENTNVITTPAEKAWMVLSSMGVKSYVSRLQEVFVCVSTKTSEIDLMLSEKQVNELAEDYDSLRED